MRGSRVAIVGGSIAGCATAIALSRLGCQVEVFERSSGALRDRGSGITIPVPLRDELVEAGYLPSEYPHCVTTVRWWIVDDGSPAGRLLWEQPTAVGVHNNWSVLWGSLRSRVADEHYHEGVALAGFASDRDGVLARFADGTAQRFDLLVGADGYRSVVRKQIQPDSRTNYAGYVAWRGNYPEARLRHAAAIDRGTRAGAGHTVCFDGGHAIVNLIPDFTGRSDPGHRRVNWAVYAPQPPGLDFLDPTSIPPGELGADVYGHFDALVRSTFPTDYQAVVRENLVEEVSIQPIYDQLVDSYVDGRIVLTGDAGVVTRPHTGSGATKALQDARCLERLGAEHGSWDDLLAAYDDERIAVNTAIVELGRRIGNDQVEHTPDWAAMTPTDFEAWTARTLAGQAHYLYRGSDEAT